jgi:hypothetical protein
VSNDKKSKPEPANPQPADAKAADPASQPTAASAGPSRAAVIKEKLQVLLKPLKSIQLPKISGAAIKQWFKDTVLDALKTVVQLPMILIKGDGADRFAVLGFISSAVVFSLAIPKVSHRMASLWGTGAHLSHHEQNHETAPHSTSQSSSQSASEPVAVPVQSALNLLVGAGAVPALGGVIEVFVECSSEEVQRHLLQQPQRVKDLLADVLTNVDVAEVEGSEAVAKTVKEAALEALNQADPPLGVVDLHLVPHRGGQ